MRFFENRIFYQKNQIRMSGRYQGHGGSLQGNKALCLKENWTILGKTGTRTKGAVNFLHHLADRQANGLFTQPRSNNVKKFRACLNSFF